MNITEDTFREVANLNGVESSVTEKMIEDLKKMAKPKQADPKPAPQFTCVLLDSSDSVVQGLECVVLRNHYDEETKTTATSREAAEGLVAAAEEFLQKSDYTSGSTIWLGAIVEDIKPKLATKNKFKLVSKDLIPVIPLSTGQMSLTVKHPNLDE